MAEAFNSVLMDHLNACYEWKRIRRTSNDKPWLTDAIRAQMKRRKAIFRAEGRSNHWKRLDKSIKRSLDFKRRKYNEDQKKKLEAMGKTSQWYGISKYLGLDEVPKRWAITDLNPEQTPEELARDLAVHFTEITNLNGPLREGDIPTATNTAENLTRLVTKEQVAARQSTSLSP